MNAKKKMILIEVGLKPVVLRLKPLVLRASGVKTEAIDVETEEEAAEKK